MTDLHYAEKGSARTRYYRETPSKLAEAIQTFHRQSVDFVVTLGDVIDSAESLTAEEGYLRSIARGFPAVLGRHHYVLGRLTWHVEG